MGFFKDLKKKVRSQAFTMAEQPRRLPPMVPRSGFNPFRDPPREGRRPIATPVNPNIQSVRDFVDNLRAQNTLEDIETGALPPAGMSMPVGPSEAGLLPLPRPRKRFKPRNKFMPGRFRPLPQIIPERMPSPSPTPRFFGGGLRSIFAGLPQFMERFEEQRARERMSPPLPRAPLPMPMPEDMPRDPFMFMRPQFAEGEGVDINRIIADQGAREGISPAERRVQSIREFLGETGRTVSNRDAELYGMGVLSFEDIMQKAEPITNRNLEQQEQMFFPKEEKSFRDFQRAFKGTRMGDVLSYLPDQLQVADYMNYKREQGSLDDILEDLEKKN